MLWLVATSETANIFSLQSPHCGLRTDSFAASTWAVISVRVAECASEVPAGAASVASVDAR